MKKFIFSLCFIFFTGLATFCQDYVADYSLKDGYTLVYKKLPAVSQYQTQAEKTYGVINSENKIVVPMLYKSIFNSGEKGIFIVKDASENEGLFSAIDQKVVVEPQFFQIESFSEGLATVKKRKPDYGFAWGAVDVNGNIVIPVEYDYLGASSQGLINFQKNNKMGFIDRH